MDKINQLRQLLRENRFAEAREILQKMNHPKRKEWLLMLENAEASYNLQLPRPEQSAQRSTLTTKALPNIEKPEPSENLFGAIIRVFLAGLIAFAVIPIIMIVLDTQVFHFSDFLMDEGSRRVGRTSGFFLFASALLFGVTARLLAGVADMFAGAYYAILFVLVIPIWHYGSFYVAQGSILALGSPLDSQSFTAYWNYLNAFPVGNDFMFLVSIVIPIAFVYSLGALSEKDFANRLKEMERS